VRRPFGDHFPIIAIVHDDLVESALAGLASIPLPLEPLVHSLDQGPLAGDLTGLLA